MADTILIKSALKPNDDGSHPLAIYERDDAHPVQRYGKEAGELAGQPIVGSKGEIYVSGDTVAEAGKTPAVIAAIQGGRVRVVDAEGNPQGNAPVPAPEKSNEVDLTGAPPPVAGGSGTSSESTAGGGKSTNPAQGGDAK